ncbi:MAG: LLM class flavin-dependent oxidoreductase, partial [Ginsengibacter sp.]
NLDKPYVLSCVNVIAADTDAEAEKLATSLFQMFLGIITGIRKGLQPPVDSMEGIWTEYQKEALDQMLSLSFIGSPKTIKKDLKDFVDQTKIDEIMIISNIYDQQAKLHSYELFAKIMLATD